MPCKLPTITPDKESVVILIEFPKSKVDDNEAFQEMMGPLGEILQSEHGAMVEEACKAISMRVRLQFSSSFADRIAEPAKMGSEFGPGVKASLEINAKSDFSDVLAFAHPP